MGTLPGMIYQTQAKSPIFWQPWTEETMKRAEAAGRLVFAVIAMPQQAGYQTILSALAADPALVALINQNYVPVLIDGEASREIGLLTADLCSELKRGLQLPIFLWMTSEGNPVAWIPVNSSEPGKVSELFNQSHSMVYRTWEEEPAYVLKNSALDNDSRRTRLSNRKNANMMSDRPAVDVVRALRQLTSYYDPFSRSFDEAGGIFPAGSIDLLATAAVHPGVPPEVRKRCLDTTHELLVDLLPSAMFDPLAGGVFATRRGTSWALPGFSKDCGSHARIANALFSAYRATGDRRALEKALDLIEFAEKSFATPDGLFAIGASPERDPAAWLWSVEDIENELPPEHAAWWIKASGMTGLGNLPSEVDTQRLYFRSNSLAVAKTVAEIAAERGESVQVFAPRYQAVREKLLARRNSRLGEVVRDNNAEAGVSFRMVSAYAAAFGATGDVAFRNKAVALLAKSRESFSSGPRLRAFAKDAPSSVGEGRAFLYGLAIQAVLDVATITSEEKLLTWSEDLATTAAELFTDSGFIKECPSDANIIDLPVTDLVMLFDDSTAGLVSFAECRLAERGRPLVASFSESAIPLPTIAVDRPILHTDLLQATMAREFKVTLVSGGDLAPELKLATERLPMRMIQRRKAKADDGIPAGSVKFIYADGTSKVVSTADALQEAALPSAKNS